MGRGGLLQRDEHHVMQAECELPDYVDWRRKTKMPRILLRSRVNTLRVISRTLAICEMNPGACRDIVASHLFRHIDFQVAAHGQSTLARFIRSCRRFLMKIA